MEERHGASRLLTVCRKPFFDPELAQALTSTPDQDIDMEGDGNEAVVTGNMRRDLWKKTCKAIATNVSPQCGRLGDVLDS